MTSSLDRTLLSRIEDASINASAPPQQRWVDGWIVRYSPGKAKRARCINAVANGVLSVEEKLQTCRRVFDAAGLPLYVRLTPFSRPADLDERLAAHGMIVEDDTCVLVRPRLDDLPEAPPLGDLSLERVGHRALARQVGRFRGSPAEQREAHAERLERSPVPYQGYILFDRRGEAAACGQIAMESDLVGLYDVFTAQSMRGRGLARAVCLRLLQAARAQGARTAYLQVEHDNRSARQVYAALGFEAGYRYHYRTAPHVGGL